METPHKEFTMLRTWGKTLALTCASLVLGTTLATAAATMGTVTAIDPKGTATVKTDDGKKYKVQDEGWTVGTKVTCEITAGKTECRAM